MQRGELPGVVAADLWAGVEPPDSPGNARAQVSAKGIAVHWDPVPLVPTSFDPGRGTGFCQTVVHNDAGQSVYGAISYLSEHTIPTEKEDMKPGQGFGNPYEGQVSLMRGSMV